MTRDEALALIKQKVKNKNLIKHMLACEKAMEALALKLGEDPGSWKLAGLLHDIDVEETAKQPELHGITGGEWLKKYGVSPAIIEAIEAHPGHPGKARKSKMAKALYAVDPLTGLIVAAALIRPEKKIACIDREFIMKRFREKRFAAGADRDQIRTCSELGINLEDFVELTLEAMKQISDDLGL